MRASGAGGAGRTWPAGLAALVLVLVLLVTASPAAAQFFDFSNIFGDAEETTSAPARPAPQPPLQSLPVRPFDPNAAPSAADYARITAEGVPPAAGATGTFDAIETYVRIFRARLVSILKRVPDATNEIGTTLAAASPTGKPIYFLGIAVFAALLLTVGRAFVELYFVFVARPIFLAMQRPNPIGYVGKMPVLTYRVLLGTIGVVLILTIASLVGLIFYDDHPATVLTVLIVFSLYAVLNLVNTVWRMVLAPYLPEYRLPPLTNTEARRLYLWANGASVFGLTGAAFCYWVHGLGLPREVHVLVTLLLTAGTVALLVATIRVNAEAVRRMILSGREPAEASWITRVAAVLWSPVVQLYLVFSWGDLAFRLVMGIDAGPGRVLFPYLILIGGLVVYGAIMYVIERVFARRRRMLELNREADERRRAEEEAESAARMAAIRDEAFYGDGTDSDADGEDEGGPRPVPSPAAAASTPAPALVGGGPVDATGSTAAAPDGAPRDEAEPDEPAPAEQPRPPGMRTMEDLARRVASLIAVGVGAYVLLRYWGGADLFAETAFFGIAEDLIDVLLIGYIVFHAVRIWLDQKIAEEGGDEPVGMLDGEGGGAGASRLATLLPLVRNTILAIIVVTVVLLVAMEMGVNVAPLFAGAGIVGLAIGFGAQTLVRDIISGAFFLIDDAFRKGEYIDVGSVKGTVEKISIRSFQLRHHLGMLHTIPFGEITHLTNFSRDWVMMKLPLRLTYDTDVEKVRKLVKKLGQALLEDETIGDKFLQPLKSQGVIQMEDSAMIVRVKFMTRPGDQWVVRKRVYQEIRDLFEREGVHFAHREVTVRIPGLPKDGEIDQETGRAIGAAARTAVDVVEAEALPATGTLGRIDDR